MHPTLPYLSFSRIDKYLTCPERYRLYYLEGLRPRASPSALFFGSLIHQSLAELFKTGVDPVSTWKKLWGEVKDQPIRYGDKESWESLLSLGSRLLDLFLAEEVQKIGKVVASEDPFELSVSTLDVPLVGVVDLVTEGEEGTTLIDFKTSSKAYAPHEAQLSDQLTCYQLARPEATRAALAVFVKTKEPRIDWLVSHRRPQDLLEFIEKAAYVAGEITAHRFFKRPGQWCKSCDFLPVCLGDEARAMATLVVIDPAFEVRPPVLSALRHHAIELTE